MHSLIAHLMTGFVPSDSAELRASGEGVCVYEEVVLPLQPQQRRWQYSSLAQSVRASDC